MLGYTPKGPRNFKGCQVRTEIAQAPLTLAYGILNANSFFGYAAASHDSSMVYPREATVTCAKLNETKLTTDGTAEQAKEALAVKIGKESCKGCVFANMDPAEASKYVQDMKTAILAQTTESAPAGGSAPVGDVIQGIIVSPETDV